MKKLKIAVGITGRIVILEKFPDDENHAGLHEMLEELEEEGISVENEPGTYLADFRIETMIGSDPQYDCAYLDFKLESI